jgi:hypothetical protein
MCIPALAPDGGRRDSDGMLPVSRCASASFLPLPRCTARAAGPLLFALAAAGMLGCDSPQSGGQIGGEKTSGCYELVSTPLALDEVSPLGFSAADALASIEGPRTETLLWAKGGDTVLSLDALYVGGETRFVESEFRAYGEDGAPQLDCPPAIEIDLDLGFDTADGALVETWRGTARAEATDRATFWHELDLEALIGTYQVTEVDPAEYDAVSVYASIVFNGQSVSGSLTGLGEISDRGDDPEGSVSAELFEVASF